MRLGEVEDRRERMEESRGRSPLTGKLPRLKDGTGFVPVCGAF